MPYTIEPPSLAEPASSKYTIEPPTTANPSKPGMFSLQAVRETVLPPGLGGRELPPEPEPMSRADYEKQVGKKWSDMSYLERAKSPEAARDMGAALSFAPANLESAVSVPAAIGAKSGVRPSAIEANKAGYVLPPAAISESPGVVPSAVAAWSGKIKTAQAASEKNQQVSNELAAQALGLPKDTPLLDQAFTNVRSDAGKAYQAVAKAVPMIAADPAFDKKILALGGANSQAAQLFPKIMKSKAIDKLIASLKGMPNFPTDVGVEVVKKLRHDSNANLRARDDPVKNALGFAQREAAEAVDDLMDRNISATGQPDIIAQYRKARQTIAKSYDVQSATNPATGDVRAARLAALAARGRPLSGELDTIAKTAAAFPKATQAPASFGHSEDWSALDFFAATGALLAGHPEAAAVILGRPAARAALLSKPAQNLMARTPNPPMSLPWAVPAAAGLTYPDALKAGNP